MSDVAVNSNSQTADGREVKFEFDGRESEIELLARQTDTPIGKVQEIYNAEHRKLEQSARIKTFVPVLVHRRVKAILQVQRGYRA
jgi:Protein of unknown function (DUF3562)